jgi:sugar lactone lactonase YvrE
MSLNFSTLNFSNQRSMVAQLVIGSVSAIVAVSALSCPAAIAVIYVSDVGTNSIYTISSTGVKNTFATGLNNPAGLAVDASGNLFASDANSNTIYKFDPTGVRSTFTSDNLSFPVALAFDASGDLFVGNLNSGSIDVFKPDGSFLRTLPNIVQSESDQPLALAFDASGKLYYTLTENDGNNDQLSGTLNVFDTNDVSTTLVSGLSYPFGLVFDASGNLLVANTGTNTIEVVNPNNGSISDPYTEFNAPTGLVFDANGNFFVANRGSGNVFEFAPNGSIINTFVGFNQPFALAFAPDAATPTAVPEPFTIVGTLIGGTTAFRIRKRLKATNKL